MKVKSLKGKYYANLTPTEKLNTERKCIGYIFDFEFNAMPPEFEKKYLEFNARARKEMEEL